MGAPDLEYDHPGLITLCVLTASDAMICALGQNVMLVAVLNWAYPPQGCYNAVR